LVIPSAKTTPFVNFQPLTLLIADLVSRTATFLVCISGSLAHLTGGLFFIDRQVPTDL
jgi:hypothetical protein